MAPWNTNRARSSSETATDGNKKIIGYKCPIDLFGGTTKRGEVFKKGNDFYYWTANTGQTQYSKHLPKEIVEEWEPVYEEEKLMVAGHEAKFHKGEVEIGCQRFGRSEVEVLWRMMNRNIMDFEIFVDGQKIPRKLINKVWERINKS